MLPQAGDLEKKKRRNSEEDLEVRVDGKDTPSNDGNR